VPARWQVWTAPAYPPIRHARSIRTDGARTLAGLDRTGVSADPARSVDPYLDGARTLAGLDRTGVSADPARSIDPYP
jgi:hypothetical protein